ncbi:hypothetical protein HPB51_016952 [Rhipicephalus microplus]|uniref:Uncharacterized protein n=1 Tax=Rhipicephalus microplus TaxID=6941 RepID=A0A9J6F4A9_RHIMP|nr:hypothetical protein HPB51_016952 [Rhipicephalus microplus]
MEACSDEKSKKNCRWSRCFDWGRVLVEAASDFLSDVSHCEDPLPFQVKTLAEIRQEKAIAHSTVVTSTEELDVPVAIDSERLQEERLLKRILGVAEVYTAVLPETQKELNVPDEVVDLRQKLGRKRKPENWAPTRAKRPDFKETRRTIVISKHTTGPRRPALSVVKRTVLEQETAVSSSTPDMELEVGNVVRRLDDFIARDMTVSDELDLSADDVLEGLDGDLGLL